MRVFLHESFHLALFFMVEFPGDFTYYLLQTHVWLMELWIWKKIFLFIHAIVQATTQRQTHQNNLLKWYQNFIHEEWIMQGLPGLRSLKSFNAHCFQEASIMKHSLKISIEISLKITKHSNGYIIYCGLCFSCFWAHTLSVTSRL